MVKEVVVTNTKKGWNWFAVIFCAFMVIGGLGAVFDGEDMSAGSIVLGWVLIVLLLLIGVANINVIREKNKVLRGDRELSGAKPTSGSELPASLPQTATNMWVVTPEPVAPESARRNPEPEPLYMGLDRAAYLKRAGDLEGALAESQASMFRMAEAAASGDGEVMERYVIEVALILHKMERWQEESQTIQEWLDLGLPPTRQDYRIDLQKRLAKANERWAKAEGRDYREYTHEWKRLIDEHKEAQEQHRASGVAVSSTGRSLVEGKRRGYRRIAKPSSRWTPSTLDLMSPEFVTVDFETANRDSGASACQVALIKVVNARIVDRYVTYLRPPEGFDRFEFTRLHGISQRETRTAPSWAQVANYIALFVGDRPVWAHNAQFDSSVWRDLDGTFGTSTLPQRFFCTMHLAKASMEGLSDYKLPTVLGAVDSTFKLNHHEATSDAEACARIVLAAQRHVTEIL